VRFLLYVFGPRHLKDFPELGRQPFDGLEDVVKLFLLAGLMEPMIRLRNIRVGLHKIPIVSSRETVRMHIVQACEADETQVWADHHVPAMAERQLAPERFTRQLQLAHDCGEGNNVEKVSSRSFEEVLSHFGALVILMAERASLPKRNGLRTHTLDSICADNNVSLGPTAVLEVNRDTIAILLDTGDTLAPLYRYLGR